MTPSEPAAAITAMWVCDNPVLPAADPRGDGYAPAAPDRLAAFAHAGRLSTVHLQVPAGPGGHLAGATTGNPPGAVVDWLRAAVTSLHDARVAVTVAADVRDATAAWATTTAALVPVDRLQVVVTPWADPVGPRAAEIGRAVVEALTAVAGARTGVPVDACVPWWFAHRSSPDGRGLLAAVLDACDRVVLAAPGARAAGPDGVLERAAAGVAALSAAGRRFTIGVETDTPGAVGGADLTFWGDGPVALVRESRAVAGELAGVPGFDGVAVRSHRAWRRLMGV